MQRYTLRGNSLASDIRVRRLRVISRGGRGLREMMDEAERERQEGEITIFMFGVPDLWDRGEPRIKGERE